MEMLLRKKDVVKAVGMAKSTISDWIEEFRVYIPIVKQGAVAYYKPETVKVLLTIKQLREQDYSKEQIFHLLAEKGFPITVDEAVEDIEKVIQQEQTNSRDSILTIMQTLGQTVAEVADQQKAIAQQQNEITKIKDEQDEQRAQIQMQQALIERLQQELERAKEEIAATQEKQNQSWLRRLFKIK